jgi:hypothetical protein
MCGRTLQFMAGAPQHNAFLEEGVHGFDAKDAERAKDASGQGSRVGRQQGIDRGHAEGTDGDARCIRLLRGIRGSTCDAKDMKKAKAAKEAAMGHESDR